MTDIQRYCTDDSDEPILDAFRRSIAVAREGKVPFVPAIEVDDNTGRTRVGICVDLGTTIGERPTNRAAH